MPFLREVLGNRKLSDYSEVQSLNLVEPFLTAPRALSQSAATSFNETFESKLSHRQILVITLKLFVNLTVTFSCRHMDIYQANQKLWFLKLIFLIRNRKTLTRDLSTSIEISIKWIHLLFYLFEIKLWSYQINIRRCVWIPLCDDDVIPNGIWGSLRSPHHTECALSVPELDVQIRCTKIHFLWSTKRLISAFGQEYVWRWKFTPTNRAVI